jgi:nitrate/nitrite-specific signal transduction histidine kinase
MRARAWALDSRLVARRRDSGGTEISVIALDPEKKRKRYHR